MPGVIRGYFLALRLFYVCSIAQDNKISGELPGRSPHGKLARDPKTDVGSTEEGENETAHKSHAQEITHKSTHKRKHIFRYVNCKLN